MCLCYDEDKDITQSSTLNIYEQKSLTSEFEKRQKILVSDDMS